MDQRVDQDSSPFVCHPHLPSTHPSLMSYMHPVHRYTQTHPHTSRPLSFSNSIHSVAASASTNSAFAATYAASAAQSFAKNTISTFSGLFAAAREPAPDVPEKMRGDLAEAGYTDEIESGKPLPQTPEPHPFDLKPIVDDAKAGAATVAQAMSPVVEGARGLARGLTQG